MNRLYSLLRYKIPYLIIGLIAMLILSSNYVHLKFLMGWDNLNSEFAPLLSLKHALNASWSDFQSFGLVSGMAYATDIWRAFSVWVLSFIFPDQMIRYLVMILLLFIGGIGNYSLLKYMKLSIGACLIGGLFYM